MVLEFLDNSKNNKINLCLEYNLIVLNKIIVEI